MKNINLLIEKAQNGNQEAFSEIFELYQKIIFSKIKNYFLVGGEKEDLLQEGRIGLWKAIKAYDTKYVTTFKTFANVCIKRQIVTAIKSANAQKNIILNKSLRINYIDKEKDEKTAKIKLIGEDKNNPEEIILLKEKIEALKKYLNKNLSFLEKKVFLLLVKGYSYKEISNKLETKLKSIDNAIQRIKKKSKLWKELYEKLEIAEL